jgi:Zn finger protein HypA/HybF involved in hydrogenase expression
VHELSLVQGVIDAVGAEAEEKKGRVLRFEVRVGELAQFDLQLVRDLLKEMKRGTPLESAKAVVRSERAKVKCMTCGRVWGFKDVVHPMSEDEKEVVHFFPELLSTYSRCPSCSKSYLDIEEGRSVRIARVELDV